MSNTHNYPLPIGQTDSERLKFQSATLDQISFPHLQQSGILQSKIVADLGCGNGMIVLHLLTFEHLETIYAIDLFQEQLDETKKNVDAWILNHPNKKHANVEYILMDITKEISTLLETIDLIFIRFVLNNIDYRSHSFIISNIKKLLKPNGVIACEESVWDNITCSSCVKEVEEYKNFMHARSMKTGIDRNVGKRLEKLFGDAGFNVNYYQVIDRPITPIELMTMYNHIMKIVRQQVLPEEKEELFKMFDSWDVAFNSIPNDDAIIVRTSGTACITVKN